MIIFVRYPQAGSVKSRLAQGIGKEKAALVYKKFVEVLIERTSCAGFKRIIFYSPRGKENEMRQWLGSHIKMFPQIGATLGARLSSAFKYAFRSGAKKVVAIGSDSPFLDSKLVSKSFRKLKYYRCVLGPALDGGYYLVGLSFYYPEIFKGINWGTEKVLEETLRKLDREGIESSLLKAGFDIDTLDDLNLFRRRLRKTRKKPPSGLNEIINILNK